MWLSIVLDLYPQQSNKLLIYQVKCVSVLCSIRNLTQLSTYSMKNQKVILVLRGCISISFSSSISFLFPLLKTATNWCNLIFFYQCGDHILHNFFSGTKGGA